MKQSLLRFMTWGFWYYYFCRALVIITLKLGYGLHAQDKAQVPRTGGVVIAANHISSLDPPALGAVAPRRVNYMAKKELFASWLGDLSMRGMLAFPVDRSRSDMQAIKEALRRLKAGKAVGIFIQGTRNTGDAEALDGAAFLAQRAQVPIVPAAIWREGRRLRVRFGAPIPAPEAKDKQTMHALTQTTMAHIHNLIPDRP